MWEEIDNYVSDSDKLKFLRTTNNTITVNGTIGMVLIYLYVLMDTNTNRCMGA